MEDFNANEKIKTVQRYAQSATVAEFDHDPDIDHAHYTAHGIAKGTMYNVRFTHDVNGGIRKNIGSLTREPEKYATDYKPPNWAAFFSRRRDEWKSEDVRKLLNTKVEVKDSRHETRDINDGRNVEIELINFYNGICQGRAHLIDPSIGVLRRFENQHPRTSLYIYITNVSDDFDVSEYSRYGHVRRVSPDLLDKDLLYFVGHNSNKLTNFGLRGVGVEVNFPNALQYNRFIVSYVKHKGGYEFATYVKMNFRHFSWGTMDFRKMNINSVDFLKLPDTIGNRCLDVVMTPDLLKHYTSARTESRNFEDSYIGYAYPDTYTSGIVVNASKDLGITVRGRFVHGQLVDIVTPRFAFGTRMELIKRYGKLYVGDLTDRYAVISAVTGKTRFHCGGEDKHGRFLSFVGRRCEIIQHENYNKVDKSNASTKSSKTGLSHPEYVTVTGKIDGHAMEYKGVLYEIKLKPDGNFICCNSDFGFLNSAYQSLYVVEYSDEFFSRGNNYYVYDLKHLVAHPANYIDYHNFVRSCEYLNMSIFPGKDGIVCAKHSLSLEPAYSKHTVSFLHASSVVPRIKLGHYTTAYEYDDDRSSIKDYLRTPRLYSDVLEAYPNAPLDSFVVLHGEGESYLINNEEYDHCTLKILSVTEAGVLYTYEDLVKLTGHPLEEVMHSARSLGVATDTGVIFGAILPVVDT